MSFDYLASPYTHEDPFIREQRYLYALKVTADRLKRREWTYSPIVHCHEMAKLFGMPVEHEFWLEYDRTMIRAAEKVLILRIDGWTSSTGLLSERQYAEEIGKPVVYI